MSTTSRLPYRLVPALIAVVVLMGFFAAPRATAVDDLQSDDVAISAADWIAAEFNAEPSSFDDFRPGVLADIVYALAVPGTNQDVANTAADELADAGAAYVGEPGALLTGAAGKAILTAAVVGRDPSTFIADRDIVAELLDAVGTGDEAGKLADDVFNQSLAVLGLAVTSSGVPAEAGDWLVSLQCEDGSFTFAADCAGEDIDTTALAAQALLAAGHDAEADEAVEWLVDKQNDDGSFTTFDTVNANTVGAVAQALRAGGQTEAADAAATFIVQNLQFAADDEAGAGGIRWVAEDTAPNGFATLQGILAFGAPRLDELAGTFTGEAPPVPTDGACATEDGVTVIVDFKGLGGGIVIRCAEGPQSDGFAALAAAGFEIAEVTTMAGFVCRIDGLPDAASESCTDTPPATAYWSYWTAERGGEWVTSSSGAGSRTLEPGSVEGWAFVETNTAEAPGVEPPAAFASADPDPETETTTTVVEDEETTTVTEAVDDDADDETAAEDESGVPWGTIVGLALVAAAVAVGVVIALRRRNEPDQP